MNNTFNAVVADEIEGVLKGRITELTLSDLPDEDVLVEVAYSTVNFKDGLAVSEHSPIKIAQSLPMVCGIDLAGTVVESRSDDWSPGDRVLVNGFGLSENFWGGYSQFARLKSEWLVRVPDAISMEQAMALGTAGYTAMLCVLAVEDHGVQPADGPSLVTGASGGVGSVATSLLSELGYEVVASTGDTVGNEAFLTGLGASSLISRGDLDRESQPLEGERWAGVIDCVGGTTLATALSQTKYGGIVAMTGLTGGTGINTTVMPFILRNINLQGVDSVQASLAVRNRAWQRLGELMNLDKLDAIYRVATMDEVPGLCDQILSGGINGRVVISVNAD